MPSLPMNHTTVFRNLLITQTDALRSDNAAHVLHILLKQAMGHALAKRLGWAAEEEVKKGI